MTAAYSLAQLEAALWTREGGRVYAVIDGAVVPGLPARLAESRSDYDCLRRGLLKAEERERAAYVAELKADQALLRWLIDEASEAFPGWGVLMISNRPLLAMCLLARGLAEAQLPSGQRRPWRWWDPELLDTLLPSFTPAQRDQVFAHNQSLVALSPRAWIWWSQERGLLQRDERLLMAGHAAT